MNILKLRNKRIMTMRLSLRRWTRKILVPYFKVTKTTTETLLTVVKNGSNNLNTRGNFKMCEVMLKCGT